MPLPTPNSDESEDEFVDRCMNDEGMKKEYPKTDQRLAVCFDQFNKK